MNIPDEDINLCCDGDEFFPCLVRRIKGAKKEVLIETFTLGEDRVGHAILRAIRLAHKRGAKIFVTIDDWGSYDCSEAFLYEFVKAGAHLQIFSPSSNPILRKLRVYGRLHRKLAVVDGRFGYIGGINLSYQHMLESGNQAKRDFSIEMTGPFVTRLRALCLLHLNAEDRNSLAPIDQNILREYSGGHELYIRNNQDQPQAIEQACINEINNAQHEITLAVAYLYPSTDLCNALEAAAKRGVVVKIIIQAEPDEPFVHTAAQCLYDDFLKAGIMIFEYRRQPIHAKVMVTDYKSVLMGSSNLDPWSLTLNLEASAMLHNEKLAQQLLCKLREMCRQSVRVKQAPSKTSPSKRQRASDTLKSCFRWFFNRAKSSHIENPQIKCMSHQHETKTFQMQNESSLLRSFGGQDVVRKFSTPSNYSKNIVIDGATQNG